MLDSLVKTDPALPPLVAQLDCTQRSRAGNDGKVTAHHGIIPTLEPANLAAMSEKELAVYKLIRAHCLAQFLPHHEFDRTTARLPFGGQSLEAASRLSCRAGAWCWPPRNLPTRKAKPGHVARCCRRCAKDWPAKLARSI